MPKFQRYPGENPIAAKRRIMKNKLQSVRPGRINPRPGIQAPVRPGPGMPPPRPGIGNQGLRGGNISRPGIRKPGSGGSRTMNRPTMGNLMRGSKKRGY